LVCWFTLDRRQKLDDNYCFLLHPHSEASVSLLSFVIVAESRGVRYPATLHLRSPFDPENLRIQGVYPPGELYTPDHLEQLNAKRL
jgi:hypothetical protein